MFWSKKNTKKKTQGQTASMTSFGQQQRPQYENMEVQFRREAEAHKEWQRIEDIALSLKRKYEGHPEILEYIDTMRSAEKVFAMGRIMRWDNEQIREELVKNKIDDLSHLGKVDVEFAKQIYEAFKVTSVTIARVDEVTKMLLEKYADHPEYCSFVSYLHDVYIAYMQSVEQGETSGSFKDRLIAIRMEVVATTSRVNVAELKRIYEEFKIAVATV